MSKHNDCREIDLPNNPTIHRHKLSHLNDLWNLLSGDPKDYELEEIVPGRFWRVQIKSQKPQQSTEYPQIQGHWFPFDGTYRINDSSTLYFQQDANLSDTTAGTVWDGALLLAKYLPFLSSSLPLQATVLELGAGCGLAGMASAIHCQADRLVLTDLPDQLERLHRHVDCNRALLPNDTIVRPCDWFQPPSDLFTSTINHHQHARIIVLADCVWMKELVQPLFATVEQYVTDETTVLISYQARGKDTDELFWSRLWRIFSQIQVIESQESVCPIPSVFHLLCCSKPTKNYNEYRRDDESRRVN